MSVKGTCVCGRGVVRDLSAYIFHLCGKNIYIIKINFIFLSFS